MNNDSKAIITFCSHLCVGDGIRPLESKEWDALAVKLLHFDDMHPEDLLSFKTQDFIDILGETPENAQRLVRLIDRSVSLAFVVEDCESKGIHIITRADEHYPKNLKSKLHHRCPPLFYCAGDLSLLQKQSVGYVGSRNIMPEDGFFAVNTVLKTIDNGFAVVSGGAKGIDTIASETAINNGGCAIEYLGDSMLKRMKKPLLLEAIQDGQLLLMSFVVPDAGFLAGNLMARNKFIYAQSEATVIVRSDKKGGTWSGANETLRNKWCPLYCWNKPEYEGNQELIRLGCIPVDENWDGNPLQTKKTAKEEVSSEKPNEEQGAVQLLIPGFE